MFDPAPFHAEVEAAQAQVLGHVLTRAGRLLQERALTAVHAAGFPEVRESWLGLLRGLEPAGVRSSVLADRLRITRQAAGQLVSDLEDKGYLERVADPADGRAKLVRMTERGWRAWLVGLEAMAAAQAELVSDLGPEAIHSLLTHGSALLAALEHRQVSPCTT